jgi:hypothetical protein
MVFCLLSLTGVFSEFLIGLKTGIVCVLLPFSVGNASRADVKTQQCERNTSFCLLQYDLEDQEILLLGNRWKKGQKRVKINLAWSLDTEDETYISKRAVAAGIGA